MGSINAYIMMDLAAMGVLANGNQNKSAATNVLRKFNTIGTRYEDYCSMENYKIIGSLHQEFSKTDLGSLNYILGLSVTHDSSGMFLSQRKYATEILERAHMVRCNSSRIPIDVESKLVQQVCLYMHDPWEPHFSVLKRILCEEAEYCGVANDIDENCWLRNLLCELYTPLSFTMLVYCDNVSVVYLSSNPVQPQSTKHIEIDIHFVRDLVAAGQV
nr:ribonuclease H-like domain-containing protein [Tanacetum cinerariifolium]